MPKKPWDEMSADEKAESLRLEIQKLISHINGAFARVTSRLSKVEEALKRKADIPPP